MENERAVQILEAFGGKDNIITVDACITRLRVYVIDPSKANKERLKMLGAHGVLELGNQLHAIFGMKSDVIKTQMIHIIEENS